MLPISIGISRCLIGDPVRYDGDAKYSSVCNTELSTLFQLVALCPEVESGLSIPRPPVELVQTSEGIKVIGRDNTSLDVTDQLINFCKNKVPQLSLLSGFVLTPRSPSCGLNSVLIKTPKDKVFSRSGSGVFAQELRNHYPYLPLIEEPLLEDVHELSLYKIRVIFYYLIQSGLPFSNYLNNVGLSFNFHEESYVNCSKEPKFKAINNALSRIDNRQAITLLDLLTEYINDY